MASLRFSRSAARPGPALTTARRQLPLLLVVLQSGLAALPTVASPTATPPQARPVTREPAATTAAPAAPGTAAAATPPSGATSVGGAPAPFTSKELQDLLRHGSLEDLALGCRRALAEDRLDRLRQIRERLLTVLPAPQPLPVVLANADVLLGCHQPQAALTVLDRISPAAGAERMQWLLMEWRAASAALDHRRASFALQRLSDGRAGRLETLMVPVQQRQDGSVVNRSAIDLLADHLRARGFGTAAAELLLASQDTGAAGAQRRLEAVRALRQLPAQEREALLETALEQAAAVGAWGLVAELLDAQIALPSERAMERRLRLSPRIDDAYGEWRLRRQDPSDAARTAELERLLRSPRSATGHNPAPPPTASSAAPAPPAGRSAATTPGRPPGTSAGTPSIPSPATP